MVINHYQYNDKWYIPEAKKSESLNFTDGKFQRAQSFQTKCVVFVTKKTQKSFRDKNNVRKSVFAAKKSA